MTTYYRRFRAVDDRGTEGEWSVVRRFTTDTLRVTRYYYLTDHLGSVRVTVNEDGEVVHYDDYYPFGQQMPGRSNYTGTPPKEHFTDHELDTESGMYYAGARYLDPVIGRWMSVDPLEQYPGPYVYSGNNPVRLVDVDGMYAGDYFSTTGRYLGSDEKQDGKVYVTTYYDCSKCSTGATLNETEAQALQQISEEIPMDSELGIAIRTVFAEMNGGDDNAKGIVAESIRNRQNLPDNAYERADGTVKQITRKFYDVAKPKNGDKQGDMAKDKFQNPVNHIYANQLETDAWVASISATLGAFNGKSDIGKGVIFYNSNNATIYDKKEGFLKINLDFAVKGIKGVWKLK